LQKTGSVNLDRLIEKIKRLDEAKKEIEFLRGIVRSNTNQISKLLGAEEAPTHKINRRTESGNRISDSAQEDKDLTRNIRLE
jgi:ribosomal protein L15